MGRGRCCRPGARRSSGWRGSLSTPSRRARRRTGPRRRPSLGVVGSIAGVAAALAVGLLVAAAYLPGSQVGDALLGALGMTARLSRADRRGAGAGRSLRRPPRPRRAGCGRRSSPADGTTATHETACEACADDRRPRAGGRVGRARGARPRRHAVRRPRAAAAAAAARSGPRTWTVPVYGVDPYQVAVGPIHAGVIESGHFRFHVVGDRILHVDARLFYKHRGLERACGGPAAGRRARGRRGGLARRATSRTPSPTRRPSRRLRASRRPTTWRGHGRSCSSWSGSGATSTTSPPPEPGPASRPARTLPGTGGARPRARAAAHRAPVRVRQHRHRRLGAPDRRRGRRSGPGDARARSAPMRRSPGGDAVQPLVHGPAERRRHRQPTTMRCWAARRAGAARCRRCRGRAGDQPAARLRGVRAGRAAAAAGDVQARFEQRAAEIGRRATLLDGLLDGPVAPAAAAPRRGAVRARRRPRREPARRDGLRRRARRRPGRAAAPAHRLLRQLARARARRAPATSCPTSRSSTRASSSATPAWTADVRPPAPTRAPPTRVALRPRRARARSPCATSTPARATAASTSWRSRRARSTTCSASAWTSSPRPATPTSCW